MNYFNLLGFYHCQSCAKRNITFLVRIAAMGFIAAITFYHSESVIVRVVATTTIGCINAIINVQREKRIENRLGKIEEEVNKLRKS